MPPKPRNYALLTDIAALIAHDDGLVVAAVAECAADPEGWYEAHLAEYEARGIRIAEWAPPQRDNICWLNLVDQLLARHYAVELDWKAGVEDIQYSLDLVAQRLQLDIDWTSVAITRGSFADSALRQISAGLLEQGHALGCLDIDSNSYVLFLTEPQEQQNLITLAQQVGLDDHFGFGQGRFIYFDFN